MQNSDALEQIRHPILEDFEAVNQLIVDELFSTVPLIQTIAQHIVRSGGKRIRPLIVLLSARALNYRQDSEHHELATVIEFIHTATLLHDDVVDKSELRRGQQTANDIWGNEASVLVGDFLYSRAFQILARRDNIPVMKVLANTTNQLSEGEVMQLMNQQDPDISESDYEEVIRRKTAQLFSAAAEIGALISTDDAALHKTMAEFGLHLGLAYQMVDDLLDYTASAEALGKNIGDDLAEGKATLPLIYAMHHAKPEHAKLIRHAIENADPQSDNHLKNLDTILLALDETNARDYTLNCAKHHAKLALALLNHLPASPFCDSLKMLTEFVVGRKY
ncbi:polyprenyl synthetase family protein [Candidiatus Paracoxiella cheracis]|uniref:polyprenyl synthetase family protein n=1 Tax=Candidiatus Paracoxiella cheracis TaxID=3405120 RepID=UPI003BF4A465